MTDDFDFDDAFLEKFKRGPNDPIPEWAFKGEDMEKEMNEIPLFMKNLPENIQDIPALAALQALIYDGTPEEISKNFKEQGNDAFKMGEKGYESAYKYYTQGLEQNCSDNMLNALLHLNRAAVSVSRKNFRAALDDCLAALKLDPETAGVALKGNYRAAKACLGMGRLQQGLEHIQKVLDHPRVDQKTRTDAEELKKLLLQTIQLEDKRSKEQEKRDKVERKIDVMLRSRGIDREAGCEREVVSLLGPNVEETHLPRITIVPKTASQLQFPVMLFYPPYGESDCIEAMHEHTTFADTLGMVFSDPPAWDKDGLYRSLSFKLYYHPNVDDSGLYEVDLRCRLADLFSRLVKKVDRGLLAFFVLPTGHDAEFLQRFPSPPTKFK